MKRIAIIAGETSGDLHGSTLMKSMNSRRNDLEFRGIGGTRMIDEGLEAIRHVREMNFMGLVEVVKHLPFIRRTLRDCEALLESWKPDVLILIDYPGFNLRLAPLAKKHGVPVMYYISPQLWAWHSSRVSIIRKYVDRMVVLFPFEKEFYAKHGVDADFVGHPLLDTVEPSMSRDEFRTSLGLTDDTTPVIGLLPGSRRQEIDRMLPSMTGSLAPLREKLGDFTAVLGCAPELDDSIYADARSDNRIKLMTGKTYDIMAHADAVAVSSGTATLETGILGTPMVVVYKTSFLTYTIAKHLVDLENIGLINIVADKRVVPELIQNDANPENIARQLAAFVTDKDLQNKTRTLLDAARKRLGQPGAADRAAEIALEMI